MGAKSKQPKPRRQPPATRDSVSNLLYLYVMLLPEEQREFNRKLRVLRENGNTLADLANRWRASLANSKPIAP